MKSFIVITIIVIIVFLCIVITYFVKSNKKSTQQLNSLNALNSPTNVKKYTIPINNTNRTYYITGNRTNIPGNGLPILLCFPGGSEDAYNSSGTGFINYTGLNQVDALVIAFQGQVSKNKSSWINAFPWMMDSPQDDVYFVKQVLASLPNQIDGSQIDKSRIYATGKSDGAGMAIYLSSSIKLSGIAVCSGAYFGLSSINNFGNTPNSNIYIPNAPLLEIHGTTDVVMPYQGANFKNITAADRNINYWKKIDNKLVVSGKTVISNTYNANVLNYLNTIGGSSTNPISIAPGVNLYIWDNKTVHISIDGGNHDWSGHNNSGPDSSTANNMKVDATLIICKYLDIATSSYKSPLATNTDVSKIPSLT